MKNLPPNIPKRGLSRSEAAEYVGLSVGSFDAQVNIGNLPQPIAFGKRLVWDRAALDHALDILSGLTHDPVQGFPSRFSERLQQDKKR